MQPLFGARASRFSILHFFKKKPVVNILPRSMFALCATVLRAAYEAVSLVQSKTQFHRMTMFVMIFRSF